MASHEPAQEGPPETDPTLLVQRFKFLNLVQQVAALDLDLCVRTVGLEGLMYKGPGGLPPSRAPRVAGGPIGADRQSSRRAAPKPRSSRRDDGGWAIVDEPRSRPARSHSRQQHRRAPAAAAHYPEEDPSYYSSEDDGREYHREPRQIDPVDREAKYRRELRNVRIADNRGGGAMHAVAAQHGVRRSPPRQRQDAGGAPRAEDQSRPQSAGRLPKSVIDAVATALRQQGVTPSRSMQEQATSPLGRSGRPTSAPQASFPDARHGESAGVQVGGRPQLSSTAINTPMREMRDGMASPIGQPKRVDHAASPIHQHPSGPRLGSPPRDERPRSHGQADKHAPTTPGGKRVESPAKAPTHDPDVLIVDPATPHDPQVAAVTKLLDKMLDEHANVAERHRVETAVRQRMAVSTEVTADDVDRERVKAAVATGGSRGMAGASQQIPSATAEMHPLPMVTDALPPRDVLLQRMLNDVERMAAEEEEVMNRRQKDEARGLATMENVAASSAAKQPVRLPGAMPQPMREAILAHRQQLHEHVKASEGVWNSSSVPAHVVADRLAADLLNDLMGEVLGEVQDALDGYVEGLVAAELS